LNSVIPTRHFLGRPDVGEEMHISIEKGKTLIIRLMAVGPVVEGRAQRDVWFEVNGEVSFSFPCSSKKHHSELISRSVLYLSKTRTLLSKQYREKSRPMIQGRLEHQCQEL
jgi:pyruvate carboxylase